MASKLCDMVFLRMRWTRSQQLLLMVIILLLALCGARGMVLAKQDLLSGTGADELSIDNSSGGE
jgi:hypothetical protein